MARPALPSLGQTRQSSRVEEEVRSLKVAALASTRLTPSDRRLPIQVHNGRRGAEEGRAYEPSAWHFATHREARLAGGPTLAAPGDERQMTREHWQDVARVLNSVLELAPDERAAYLDR